MDLVAEIEEDLDAEVKAREESEKGEEEGHEQGVAERKKERKIYKGEIASAASLAGVKGPFMIQPMQRKIPNYGHRAYDLPPTFVATKFVPVAYDTTKIQMHYVDLRSGSPSYREIPRDFELNLLKGRRGVELTEDWEKLRKNSFLSLARRMAVTLGADPEIFVVNKKDEVVPAWEYLPSKTHPRNFNAVVGAAAGSAYWDGFQAEFTTPGYHTCLYEMTNSIQGGLQAVYSAARAQDKGYALSNKSVFYINPDVLSSAKEEHVAFGCSPSKNAYNEPPITADGRTTSVRFAGGHLHFGMASYVVDEERLRSFVKGLDAVLGVACVSLFASFDNPIRRKFYGKAGEYRTPRHGLEYRVLSNAWLMHPLLTHLTFDLARAVLGTWECGYDSMWEIPEERTRAIINNHDVADARKVLTEKRDEFKSILTLIGGSYTNETSRDVAYRMWLSGAESFIKDPEDLVDNWGLKGSWNADMAHTNQFLGLLPKLSAGKKV